MHPQPASLTKPLMLLTLPLTWMLGVFALLELLLCISLMVGYFSWPLCGWVPVPVGSSKSEVIIYAIVNTFIRTSAK